MLAVRVRAVIELLPPKKHKRIADRRIQLANYAAPKNRILRVYRRRSNMSQDKSVWLSPLTILEKDSFGDLAALVFAFVLALLVLTLLPH